MDVKIDTSQIGDTIKSKHKFFFNKNEVIYLVVNVFYGDTADSSGYKWNTIKMKNSKNEYETFQVRNNNDKNYKIGDSIWVGHNAAGEYMVRINPLTNKSLVK